MGLYISVIFVLLSGAAFAWPDGGKKTDINGDGYKEAKVFHSKNVISRVEIDLNHNGYRETVIYYKNGHREHAKQDENEDGRVDRWIRYYFTGVPWKVAEDLDGDGKPDYWFYLKNGKIYKWEQDRNGDGKADFRTTYEPDAMGKAGVLVRQSFDDDHDGMFGGFSGNTLTRKYAGTPNWLAEMLLR